MNSQEEQVRLWMMAALDDEISVEDRRSFEAALAADADLKHEWTRLCQVKEVTKSMRYRRPPEEIWDRYWLSIYNRFERGIAWILVSIGAVVTTGYGLWYTMGEIWRDSEIALPLRLAIFALVLGGAVLLISVCREKFRLWRKDPYREVTR
ncbi:MAG: hypothetical protein OEV00_05915 [Acidobacteriota bacterium]|nr:hypothetical protein [Acidobacteriota bacterium]MDH3784850.1 hypothetical protein [Acidobacteriota bacterium]